MTKKDNLLDMFDSFKRNQEIRKTDEENKKLKAKLKKEPKKEVSEEIKAINGLQRQVNLFGKTINISELQENYEFLKINQTDLINAISWGINTIKNKRPVKDKKMDNQYYRNFLTWNKLREYLIKL